MVPCFSPLRRYVWQLDCCAKVGRITLSVGASLSLPLCSCYMRVMPLALFFKVVKQWQCFPVFFCYWALISIRAQYLSRRNSQFTLFLPCSALFHSPMACSYGCSFSPSFLFGMRFKPEVTDVAAMPS